MARLLLHRGGGRFEALQYPDEDPTRFERKDLDVAQATRYRDEGGFQVVDASDFDNQLRTVSDATRKARRAAMPTEAVLRRSNPDGSAYEALEYSKADPRQATRTPVAPQDLERWREGGGFDEVSERDWRQHLNRTRGVEEAESHLRVAPDFSLDEEVPGVRGNIAPALDMRASESTSYERPARDNEYAAAQSEEDEQRRLRALGELGAGINRALTGVDYDKAAYQEAPGANPVKRLLAQREMDRKARLSDPSSPESKRLQAAVASAMPGAYTPQQLATIAAEDADYVTDFVRVRSAAEGRAAAAKEAARRAEEDRKSRENEGRLGREATIRAAGIAAAGRKSEAEAEAALKKELAAMEAGAKRTKVEGDLRSEVRNLPAVKKFEDATTNFAKLEAAANVDSAAGDIAFIYAGVNVLDPGSVVKETEAATIESARGIPDRIKAAWYKAHNGGRLSREQKEDYLRVFRAQLDVYRRAYEAAVEPYRGIATDAGVEANRVVLPPPTTKAANQPAPLPPPAILKNGKRAARTTMPDGSIWEETDNDGAKRIR